VVTGGLSVVAALCAPTYPLGREIASAPTHRPGPGDEVLASVVRLSEFPGMTATRKKASALGTALALQNKGDLAAAEAGYRAAIADDPGNPDALVLLGLLLQKTERPEEAVGAIEAGIAAANGRGRRPDPTWHIALSFAKRDSGDAQGALAVLDDLIAETTETPELTFYRAGILQRLDRHEEAIAAYERFLHHAPGHAQALNNLGISLQATGRLKEAFDSFGRAVRQRSNYVQAIVNLGRLFLDMGQLEAAIANLRRAHALHPDDRKAEFALIDALQAGNRAEEAARMAERSLERNPDDPQAMIQLGNISMILGQRDRAVELARRANEIAPRTTGGLALLAEADRDTDAHALMAEIDALLAEGQLFSQRIGLHFAAARLCERLHDYKAAFGHYVDGNAARREQLDRLEKGYDPARTTAQVDGLVKAIDSRKVSGPGGSPSELPLFIVGMPRSGTTLTEQILASHPDVVGGGELLEIGQIVMRLQEEHGFPEALVDRQVRDAANRYLTHIGKIGKGAVRVTDKMPGNFMHLGVIARMYPKARIIHCRRDPMDNCLSCFAQNFKADGLGWTTDLTDLAHYYCQYRRLMAHWRAVLPPGRMLEIDYEDTVADLEGQARRIIDFAGLVWDDRCLEFHKTERSVATASRAQVRNPIYRSSVGRWKRYGDGVLPLARALSACGCGPKAGRGGAGR